MKKQHDQKFKEDAVAYYNTHKDFGVKGCATSIGYSTLQKWLKPFKETGSISTRGSGNYASDEQAEIARLKRELHDTKDAKVTAQIQLSYSKKASFHSLLKHEWLHRVKIRDYAYAYRLIFKYIETFYNTVRSHSHCNYLSPTEYERKYRFAN